MIEEKDIQGLSQTEAEIRLKRFGYNTVSTKKRVGPVKMFLGKFKSPLLILLIAVSVVSFFLGESINAIIILIMVVMSGVLDFFNTYKSEKAIEKLVARVVTTATVWRDGIKKEINLKKVVVGDIVELTAGDIVPADGKLLEAKDFFLNQSALTGESFPVEKMVEAESEAGQVFLGTNVVSGYAVVEITQIGADTKFGQIAVRLTRPEAETSFEKGIKGFSFFIMRVTFVLVTCVFLINYFLGRGVLDSFLFAIAIAIGLTPELLPMIISVALSRGAGLMAKKDVVVKNLSAIENFGGMNILCTDKTGTLTKDKISLIRNVNLFGEEDEEIFFYGFLSSFFHTGLINHLDKAIRDFKKPDITDYKKIDEIPFDFTRRCSSVIVAKGAQHYLITKGAPENILPFCKQYKSKDQNLILDEKSRQAAQAEYNQLSQNGFRVLGLAMKVISSPQTVYTKNDETDLVFLGFMAFLDPPKESAIQTLKDLKQLGVEIKILTGDSELLTKKICQDIGLEIGGSLNGEELEQMTDESLGARILSTTIFSRVKPEQKERLVLLLKKTGATVGYLGDGINDAPALKAADVGISVNNAVDVAKETADIILLRKSLDVLKDGIVEGRKTFQNTLKYIMMGLSSNFGNMFSMVVASFLLPFLPMLPMQILLNNFLYDISQITLPTDLVDPEMIKKPLRWNFKFIKKYMILFGPVSSLFDFLTFILLFVIARLPESQFQTGWFIESIATQVLVIYIIRSPKIPFIQSRPSWPLILNTVSIVVLAWALPYFGFSRYFGFSPLTGQILLAIGLIVVGYLIVAELMKCFFYYGWLHHQKKI